MATTFLELDDAVRATSAFFTRDRVPQKLLARLCSQIQRDLLAEAQQRNPEWGAQVATIGFDLAAINAPRAVLAGGTGGVSSGTLGAATNGAATLGTAPTGWLTELDLDRSQDDAVAPVTLVGEFTPSAVTATTITKAGAGWTTNALQGAYVRVLVGPATGQRRRIVSNTATVATLEQAWGLDPAALADEAPGEADTPTTASLLDIVRGVVETNGTSAVVTQMPTVTERRGYLVRVDATGTAYLDTARPVLTHVDAAIPLPPLLHLLGGTVRYRGRETEGGDPLTILPYGLRLVAPAGPAVYQLGEALYLIGDVTTWDTVASIELRYVPVPPPFTAPTDYVLLPDLAVPALVALAAAEAAVRCEELGTSINVDRFVARGDRAREMCLSTVMMQRRNMVFVTREVM